MRPFFTIPLMVVINVAPDPLAPNPLLYSSIATLGQCCKGMERHPIRHRTIPDSFVESALLPTLLRRTFRETTR